MLDPTSELFAKWTELFVTGDMTGHNRPIGRVTLGKNVLREIKGRHVFRSIFEDQPLDEELPGIVNITIDRSLNQDAATCTIRMVNDYMPSWDSSPEGRDTLGRPGYYMPTRGQKIANMGRSIYARYDNDRFSVGWDYPENSPIPGTPEDDPILGGHDTEYVRGRLIPNRLLRTYQGYGSDNLSPDGHEYELRAPGDPDYVHPRDDSQLVCTGTWLIDKVTFRPNGLVVIECRDLAKLLIEQMAFPPMVPVGRYPLSYGPRSSAEVAFSEVPEEFWGVMFTERNFPQTYHEVVPRAIDGSILQRGGPTTDEQKLSQITNGGPWESEYRSSSSDVVWVDVQPKAIPTNPAHYPDNAPPPSAYFMGLSWLTDSTLGGEVMNGWIAIKLRDGRWLDLGLGLEHERHPHPDIPILMVENGRRGSSDPTTDRGNYTANARFHWLHLSEYPARRVKLHEIDFVRLYLTNLVPASSKNKYSAQLKGSFNHIPSQWVNGELINFNPIGFKYVRRGYPPPAHPYGPGGTQVQNIHGHTLTTITNPSWQPDPGLGDMTSSDGMLATTKAIGDWSHAIRELCAWAGFVKKYKADSGVEVDSMLGTTEDGSILRVWGDIEILGAGPVEATPYDYFLNKSFMECISLIADFIGHVFHIDEHGGVIFMPPNIWGGGNYIHDPTSRDAPIRILKQWPIEFHEQANLLDYQVTLDDSVVRSEILVIGDTLDNDELMPVTSGYMLGTNPETGVRGPIDFDDVLAGQTRLLQVPQDSTRHFKTKAELQRYAQMLAVKILFNYRKGRAKILAHPGLQLNDQVRIVERQTYETNIHYVSAITSEMDLTSGSWTMDVTTHWLGTDPDTDWFWKVDNITPALKYLPMIIKQLGELGGTTSGTESSAGTGNPSGPPLGLTDGPA